MDVHVLGGGAWGCSAALSLAEAGHDVLLVEPRGLGAGSTHRSAGLVSALTWDRREYRLITETRGAIGELIALAMIEGADVRDTWRPVDSLLVGPGDALTAVQRVVESQGEETERLAARAAGAAYPMLSFDPREEVLVAQEDGVADAGLLMQALQTRMEGEGVTVARRRPEDVPEATVYAAGAWTHGLVAKETGVRLPLQAFRTQAAILEMPGDIPMVHDLHHSAYARPSSEDTILAGDGTRLVPHDPDDYDEATDPMFRDHIAAAVSARFRHGAAARMRTGWAGLCVATPDRHPLCGAVPGTDQAFVLTGDNGFGLMRCLALGARLADAVDGKGEEWLDPARFRGQDLDGFTMREGFSDLTA